LQKNLRKKVSCRWEISHKNIWLLHSMRFHEISPFPWDFISVYSWDLSLDPHTSTMGVSLSHYSKALLLLESSWHNGWLWWWTENPLTAFALYVQDQDVCNLLLLLCSAGLEKVPEVVVTIQDPLAFCCLL